MKIGHYRRTTMGGITHPVALKVVEKKLQVIRPIRIEGRGTHRRYLYPDDIDVLIHLEQSNSGYRSLSLQCKTEQTVCEHIKQVAEQLWLEGSDAYSIERALTLLTLP
jgi:hypothetical protein